MASKLMVKPLPFAFQLFSELSMNNSSWTTQLRKVADKASDTVIAS